MANHSQTFLLKGTAAVDTERTLLRFAGGDLTASSLYRTCAKTMSFRMRVGGIHWSACS